MWDANLPTLILWLQALYFQYGIKLHNVFDTQAQWHPSQPTQNI